MLARHAPELVAGFDRNTHMYGDAIPARNLHLIMGTMLAHPRTFIIIGLLYHCCAQGSPEEINKWHTLIDDSMIAGATNSSTRIRTHELRLSGLRSKR